MKIKRAAALVAAILMAVFVLPAATGAGARITETVNLINIRRI